jgi:hypothetical protein
MGPAEPQPWALSFICRPLLKNRINAPEIKYSKQMSHIPREAFANPLIIMQKIYPETAKIIASVRWPSRPLFLKWGKRG